MRTVAEIPRPPWSPRQPELPHDVRVETPLVQVEPQWEYREVVREPGAALMTAAELDDLGASHWELVGVVSAVDGVLFFFKRERRR